MNNRLVMMAGAGLAVALTVSTLLHARVQAQQLSAVVQSAAVRASVDQASGVTALHSTASRGHREARRLIVAKGAQVDGSSKKDLERRDACGRTPCAARPRTAAAMPRSSGRSSTWAPT